MSEDLTAPDGYYWKSGVYNDEEHGWTGFAELYSNSQKTGRKWWQGYTAGTPYLSAHKVHFEKGPEELIQSAKRSVLEDYAKEMERAQRDREFREYGRTANG